MEIIQILKKIESLVGMSLKAYCENISREVPTVPYLEASCIRICLTIWR